MNSKLRFATHTAVAALLLGITGAAQAQDANELETVTVTGFRASLATALESKQRSNLIMESVASEDIGKMPDQNVAESLQRLPGIQIARDQGKGTRVLINGLRQNLTTLNGDVFLTGREFYVSGEAANGGAGANAQYASLEGIPSEEIGGIDIYKSPNASLTEGGMGGIINLKTRNALDAADGFSMTAALRGTSTSYQSTANATPNATLVASYKPNNVFAITGSVSYDDTSTKTLEYEAYNRDAWLLTSNAVSGYTGAGPLNDTNGKTNLPGGAKYLVTQHSYFSDIYVKNKTIGATLGVNWNVSDSIQTSLNWFFTHISDKQANFSNKVGFNGSGTVLNTPAGGIPGIDMDSPYTIDDNYVVEDAVFYLQGAETATLYQRQASDAHNFQWHTSFDNGGPITATLDVSFANAKAGLKAAQQDIEHGYYGGWGVTGSILPTAPGCNNFGTSCTTGNPAIPLAWTNGGTSGLPTAEYLAPYANVLSNANYALFKSGWAWANDSKQQQGAIRGEIVYKPSFLKAVDGVITGGFRIAKRDVWQDFGRYLIQGLDVNGNIMGNCCWAPGNGAGLYYQDPSYSPIPYDTALSNPDLALTVHSFMFGDMIVKDPFVGGMASPETFLNTIWNQAAFVPSGTPSALVTPGGVVPCNPLPVNPAQALTCSTSVPSAVPNDSEALYKHTLSSFKVHETTQSYYLMGDMGSKDQGFHLNAGVRVVVTHMVISGASANGNNVLSHGTATWNGVNSNDIPFTEGKDVVDILPSFNLALFPTDDQVIRLSGARVVSPADLFNLGVGRYYNFSRETGGRINTNASSPWFGTADGYRFANGQSGNPDLDPYRANQFNLSWEWYFQPEAMVSVGTFYKQVESFEVQQPVNAFVDDDFGGTEGPMTMAVNAGHGSIYGLELAGQYVHETGFGVAANYTYTQSQSAIFTAFSDHLPIPDVSAHAATGTLFYSNYGLDARVSYSWRSKAVNGGIGGATFSPKDATNGGTPVTMGVFTAPYGQLDAQIAYNLTDNINIYVSGQNLTEEAFHTYLQFPNQPYTYDNSGARYFFGVRFTY